MADSMQILEHLRNSKVTRLAPGRAQSLEGSGIALERIEGVDCFAVGPCRHELEEKEGSSER